MLSQVFDVKIPQDICYRINPKWSYEYWVSPDRKEYVLKAVLLRPGILPFDDLDGNILGDSCGEDGPQEREYCTSPHF